MATLQDNYNCYMLIEKQAGNEKAQEFLMSLPYWEMRHLSERLVWEKADLLFTNMEKAIGRWVEVAGQDG